MIKPCRKNNRLADWDYSSNATYHVTLCAARKQTMFGHVEENDCGVNVVLSDKGKACEAAINEAAANVAGLAVDNYVIMPNHVHLLLSLSDGCNLGRVIARIKSKSIKMVRETDDIATLWQRGYHEHIIRDEADYQAVWEYIDANPAKWADDELYVR